MVTPRSTQEFVDEPLDLYMVYLYPDPDGKYMGDSEDPFMFEFYANDVRHAMEQFMDMGTSFLSPEIDIARVEIKQVDPFYNEDIEKYNDGFLPEAP